MTAITTEYGSLTLAVTKASSLAATNVVVGVLDEFNRGRKYSPFLMDGFAVQTGDAAATWLPSVVSVTAIQAQDPVSGTMKTGQYRVVLQPGASDTANVASVQTMVVDPNALFITATSTF